MPDALVSVALFLGSDAMLADLLTYAGSVLPFVRVKDRGPKTIELQAVVIDDRARDTPPPQRVSASVPAVAIKEFVGELTYWAGGGELRFLRVAQSYKAMARDNGWPALSDKVLSQMLVQHGCRRRQADLRKHGDGRPTMITLPRAA